MSLPVRFPRPCAPPVASGPVRGRTVVRKFAAPKAYRAPVALARASRLVSCARPSTHGAIPCCSPRNIARRSTRFVPVRADGDTSHGLLCPTHDMRAGRASRQGCEAQPLWRSSTAACPSLARTSRIVRSCSSRRRRIAIFLLASAAVLPGQAHLRAPVARARTHCRRHRPCCASPAFHLPAPFVVEQCCL